MTGSLFKRAPMLEYYVENYGSRHFCVRRIGGELICVTVYRKGAANVAFLLNGRKG